MKSLTTEEYKKLADKAASPSKGYKNIPLAFLCGGLICAFGQGLTLLYRRWGLSDGVSTTAVSITLVFAAVLLTDLNIFDRIAKHAGAGTLVPITGFANAVASPALEFKSEGLITGLAAKMFIIAGPVIVYGVSAATVYGLVLLLFGLV